MKSDSIQTGSVLLSKSILAEPWQNSEPKIRALLGEFHGYIAEFSTKLSDSTETGPIEQLLAQTRITLTAIGAKISERSIVELSNLLATDLPNLINAFEECSQSK
jgi:hypothetical protein